MFFKKDPYLSSGFMALQLAIEDSFFKMWKKSETTEIEVIAFALLLIFNSLMVLLLVYV